MSGLVLGSRVTDDGFRGTGYGLRVAGDPDGGPDRWSTISRRSQPPDLPLISYFDLFPFVLFQDAVSLPRPCLSMSATSRNPNPLPITDSITVTDNITVTVIPPQLPLF